MTRTPGNSVEIERDVFEHLLNCLANQKYLHEMKLDQRVKMQAVIDEAWRKGMDLLAAADAGE